MRFAARIAVDIERPPFPLCHEISANGKALVMRATPSRFRCAVPCHPTAIHAVNCSLDKSDVRVLISADAKSQRGLPPQFLTKILRRLTATDLVTSQRGRSGGFRLNRPADQISLLELVLPFEHQWDGVECILGQAYCTDQAACPIHDEWVGIRRSIFALLERTTLADVADRAVRTSPTSDHVSSGEKQP